MIEKMIEEVNDESNKVSEMIRKLFVEVIDLEFTAREKASSAQKEYLLNALPLSDLSKLVENEQKEIIKLQSDIEKVTERNKRLKKDTTIFTKKRSKLVGEGKMNMIRLDIKVPPNTERVHSKQFIMTRVASAENTRSLQLNFSSFTKNETKKRRRSIHAFDRKSIQHIITKEFRSRNPSSKKDCEYQLALISDLQKMKQKEYQLKKKEIKMFKFANILLKEIKKKNKGFKKKCKDQKTVKMFEILVNTAVNRKRYCPKINLMQFKNWEMISIEVGEIDTFDAFTEVKSKKLFQEVDEFLDQFETKDNLSV